MMKDRIYSSALILGVLICALLIRYFVPIVFDVFWLAIVIVSIYEVTRVFKRRGNTAFEWIPYTYAVAFLALVLIPIFLDLAFYQMIILQLTLLIAVSIVLLILPFCFSKKIVYDEQKFGSAREYLMNKSITTLNIIIYPALLLGLMYMLNHINTIGLVDSGATDEVFGLFAIRVLVRFQRAIAGIRGEFHQHSPLVVFFLGRLSVVFLNSFGGDSFSITKNDPADRHELHGLHVDRGVDTAVDILGVERLGDDLVPRHQTGAAATRRVGHGPDAVHEPELGHCDSDGLGEQGGGGGFSSS